MSMQDLIDCDAEFLILLQGFDETFSQTVHTKSSYRAEEVVFGARFASMFDDDAAPPGEVSVDVRRLHDVERVSM
jgi:inward rectifier potassium channel